MSEPVSVMPSDPNSPVSPTSPPESDAPSGPSLTERVAYLEYRLTGANVPGSPPETFEEWVALQA